MRLNVIFGSHLENIGVSLFEASLQRKVTHKTEAVF